MRAHAPRHAATLLALAVTAVACAPAYVYLPTEQVTAVVDGQPAARYPIPPEAPTGDVRLHSFGVVDLGDEGGGQVPTLHLRFWISHDIGTQPWVMDTRTVRLELRRGGESRPTLVAAGRDEALPRVEIPPGQQRVVEMFFPLPAGLDEEDALPAFDVIWQVQTEARVVGERTPFERVRVEAPPPPPTWGFSYGYGYGWWYDPWWRPGAGYAMGGRGVVVLNREVILQPRMHDRPMRPARPAR